MSAAEQIAADLESLFGVYDRLDTAVWLHDLQTLRIVWSNTRGLDLFGATSLDELCARPKTALSRDLHLPLEEAATRVRRFGRMETQWTFYPLDEPLPVNAACNAFFLPDHPPAMLVEAHPLAGETHAEMLRGAEALRHTPVLIAMFDISLERVLANPAWTKCYGDRLDLIECFADEAQRDRARAALEAGEPFSAEIEARTKAGTRWHELEANWTVDPITSMATLLVHCHDITDRKQHERLKDELISVVSHELRTPLTSIRGALGLVRGGALGPTPPALEQMLGIAWRNSAQLLRLVDDLLTAQRAALGTLDLEPADFDLVALLDQGIEDARPFVDTHDVRLTVQHRDPSLPVRGDRARVVQVLTNLVSNAAKFSPPQGVVNVASRRLAHQAEFTVSDQGPGIPAAQRELVFERFFQADSSATRTREGVGLGLSICRAIVEAHGGTIHVEAPDEGGSRFVVQIPLKDAE